MTDFLDRLGPLALPLTVFIAIEAAAVSFAVAALFHLNTEHPRAVWQALGNAFAPRDVFTERGWRYRLWALKLQAVALVWVLLMPLLF